MMNLVSVNVGQPRELQHGDRLVRTAIVKSPVAAGQADVHALGVEGDVQVDRKHHGGIHQAVYAYFQDSYDYWRRELDRDHLLPGQFGENLTIEGMSEETICIGDVFLCGDAQLQVSQPRQPCFKLGIVMGGQGFVQRFLDSGRLGAYFRVLSNGMVRSGMEIKKLANGVGDMTLSEVCRLRFFDKNDLSGALKCANLPDLSPEWRAHFANRVRGTEVDPQQQLWPDSK